MKIKYRQDCFTISSLEKGYWTRYPRGVGYRSTVLLFEVGGCRYKIRIKLALKGLNVECPSIAVAMSVAELATHFNVGASFDFDWLFTCHAI